MSTITNTRLAGKNHAVHTVEGGKSAHMKKPCPTCPWREDAVGEFPAEAFAHSAPTAYDLSERSFACHQAGSEKPKCCAGAILSSGAGHNLQLRIRERIRGEDFSDVSDGGHKLFGSYREMAVANGVDPDDPILAPCR